MYLGLDIGGTKCAVVVGTGRGEVVDRREWPSEATRGPASMIDDLCTRATELRARHGHIEAAGVSIGGPLDVNRGIIHSPPNLPGWDDIPLRRILEERLGLPVHIEHDAAACAKAEALWGAGRGLSRVVYLTCGTGFGMGFVLDGRTYRGADGQTCEIGHIRYRPDGPEAFGKVGSYEAFAAGASLGKLATWAFPQRWPVPPTGQELAQLAAAGDADARHIIELNATAVGDACAMIADLLCPQIVLLGSLARYLGESWIGRVRSRFDAEMGAGSRRRCPIQPAGLGERLQDCSALAAAIASPAATEGAGS